MTINRVLIILGIYIFAMGVVGFVRTGSFTPLILNGTIASVTVWLGWLNGQGMRSVRSATKWWLITVAALLGYMTFGQVVTYGHPNLGSALIFGSKTLFTVLALVLVVRSGQAFERSRFHRF